MTKDEAMQQALEALKESIDVPCYGGHPKQEAAYHALQEALAEPPAQRTWVGLTEEEIVAINDKYYNIAYRDFEADIAIARTIEATLRSKNENNY